MNAALVQPAMEGITYEIRQTVYEVLSLKTDWRRLSRRLAPAAGVALLGTGLLWLRKRQLEPQELLLLSSFNCRALHFKSLKDLQQRSDFAALQRAARRLRGPIERDLMANEDLEKLIQVRLSAFRERTCQEWTLRGYFKEPETVKRPREAFPGIDLITQVGLKGP